MDPITTAIVTAAGTGLATGVVRDSYDALKAILQRKFGGKKDLVDAVNKIEEQSDSQARRDLLKEEVDKARVNDDPEILNLAQDLLSKIKEQPGGQEIINQTQINTMTGNTVSGSVTFAPIQEGKKS